MRKYTEGRLSPPTSEGLLQTEAGEIIATVRQCAGNRHANAERLCAAWNAVEGFSAESLTPGLLKEVQDFLKRTKRRLKSLNQGVDLMNCDPKVNYEVAIYQEAAALLEKLRKEKTNDTERTIQA